MMRLRKEAAADAAARELRAAAQENFEARQKRLMTTKRLVGAQEEPPWARSTVKGEGLEDELEKKVVVGGGEAGCCCCYASYV